MFNPSGTPSEEIRLYNSGNLVTEGVHQPQEFGVYITIYNQPGGVSDLEQWSAQHRSPLETVSDLQHFQFQGNLAIRWISHGPVAGSDAIQTLVSKGDRVYWLYTLPANSLYLDTFNQILQSLYLP